MDRMIVEYLANAVWQVPLLVGAVAALLWALGAEVRTRHRAWLVVLVIALLMPLRGMELPGGPETLPARPLDKVSHAEAAPWTAAVMPAENVMMPRPVEAPRKPLLVFGEVSGRWLVRLYAAFILIAAWRIGRCWIAAQQLLRRSRSIDLAPRAMAIFAQAAHHQDVALPRLRQSDETISPVVIGAHRPVLLLPAGFDHLKDDEILAALSHEFAHLKRRDYLVNLLCQIASLPLAWHPAIHYVHRRIRDTREMLCDAAAAQEMASPIRYATCLVAFALRALDGRDAALATQGLSMFDNRILEERILHLTQAPEEPEPTTRLTRLACATIGLVMAVTMALLFHVTPTWAETPVAREADPPVPLPSAAPQVELPAIPAAPAAAPNEDMQRAIDEEKRQRDLAQRKRDEAQRKKDLEQAQRDEEQHGRDMTQAQHDIEQAQQEGTREAERAKRDVERALAQAQREAAREAEQAQREAAQEAAEAAREATQASRDAIHEAEHQAAEARRLADQIKRQVADATSYVRTPEFQEHMSQLRDHMQELHEQMAELGQRMKRLDKETSRN